MALLCLGVEAEPAERFARSRLELVTALVDVAVLDIPIAQQQFLCVRPRAVSEQRLQRGHLVVHGGEVFA